MADDNNNNNGINRERLAKLISIFVLTASGILTIGGITVALTGPAAERWDTMKDVFSMMLPLWGTWIGTILAFYFSRENFESANRSVKELVNSVTSDQKLKSTPAKDVMRPIASIKGYDASDTAALAATPITEILKFMADNHIFRLPFFNAQKMILYILHKSTIDSFISSEAMEGTDTTKLTFGNLLSTTNPDIKKYVDGSVETVGQNASLLEVKTVMDKNPNCLDVFVTSNGTKTEPVLGWITNDKLLEQSRV